MQAYTYMKQEELSCMDKKKFLKINISVLAAIVIGIILIHSKIISVSILNGLNICLNILIPSMFVFLIVSDFCQETNALKFVLKPIEPIVAKLFKIDRRLTSTIFFSLLCGYPTGAYLIANLLENNQITKKTATRLMCFCVNSGPAFLIGAVSVPLTGDIVLGLILFFSQTIAFFVVGVLCSLKAVNEKIENKNVLKAKKTFSQIFINSISRSIKTMAIICGFALLFSAIIGVLFEVLALNFENNEVLKAIIYGFFEITNGISAIGEIESMQTILSLALISAFGGLCVHCQLKAILSKFEISLKGFYMWRSVYCAVSLLSCFAIVRTLAVFRPAIALNKIKPGCSTNNVLSSICLIILSIALLCCDKKNIIIKKNN